MNRRVALGFFAIGALAAPHSEAATPASPPRWIADSNRFTQLLLDVQIKHSPEYASSQGLAAFDAQIAQPTLADELAERAERDAAIAQIKAKLPRQRDLDVIEDLQILIHAIDLEDRQQDFNLRSQVPFINPSEAVFRGLRTLLDDQVAAERRPAALARLRKYAGVEAGYKPLTELSLQRIQEQMAKPEVNYPSRAEIETELGRNGNYVEGISALFTKYQLSGWEEAYAKLKLQLTDYDEWVRATLLPKARADFRLPPEQYRLNLERYGIDVPPEKIAVMAHAAFKEYQDEMQPIAAQIADRRQLPNSDYRAVIAALKKDQITGDAILPFYEQRLKEIEAIIVQHDIVTLPNRPALIRLATAAETAQTPAPHMKIPPFLHNTGQRGEFVLPLNLPSASGGPDERYDDFTFDAVAWTLTAHEARPGHELQFDSMVERGVSVARAQFAFNSTNAEGWGLYSEYLIKPYMPLEGQLMSLDLRLLRAARAYLDPELQSGKLQPADAYRILENDVVLSHAFATEEVERYTFNSPGQANSYFYGYMRLLELRKATESALGKKFDQRRFHDFILTQGLLPPDLMQNAVFGNFIGRRPVKPH
jgi:hypothetical protein